MAKSIDAMAKVDAVYFVKGWNLARGCRIERKICEEYGVKILYPDFLEDRKEELVREPIIINDVPPIIPTDYKITCEDNHIPRID